MIGGFNDKNQIVRNVSVYDPKTSAWSESPELPEGSGRAFAPAAVVHHGSLYTSVSDGTLLRLDETTGSLAEGRQSNGQSSTPTRLVLRDKVLVIGGASGGKNFDLIEAISAAR